MNYLTVERFMVNQMPLEECTNQATQRSFARGDARRIEIGDIVKSNITGHYKVIAMAVSVGRNGVSCLLEQPSTQDFRGDEPWTGTGWQNGYNEDGEYVVRRVLKLNSLILVSKAYDNRTEEAS
jgi:hypothetical protein